MTDRGAQTIDLGDVKIDDLFGDSLPSRSAHASGQKGMAKGLDLFAESGLEPFDAARELNPQRPMNPENLEMPTDLGLSAIHSITVPESGLMVNYGVKERLKELRIPLVLGVLLLMGAIAFGPDLLKLMNTASKPNLATRIDADFPPAAPVPVSTSPTTRRETVSPINRELIGNPYWALPNRLQVKGEVSARISPQQEARWRFGLSHRYPYQRYATAREIRRTRMKSAAFLLLETLEQPKFWTRMEALFGLAEMGLRIDVDTVEKGLGDARSSLVANYFRRFIERRPSSGELYVMRQAIRVVDARARLVILMALSQIEGDLNQLYLIAADYDPSPSIQAWLEQERRFMKISSLNRERYQVLLNDYMNSGSSAETPQIQELKVEELAEVSILNEVQFFQELIDHEEESIASPDEFDGFETLR